MPLKSSPVGLYVSAGLSVGESYAAVVRATRSGVLLAIGAGLATSGATWMAGRSMFVRPLQNLKLVLERWRAGDCGVRTGLHDDQGEIGHSAPRSMP